MGEGVEGALEAMLRVLMAQTSGEHDRRLILEFHGDPLQFTVLDITLHVGSTALDQGRVMVCACCVLQEGSALKVLKRETCPEYSDAMTMQICKGRGVRHTNK